MKRRITKLLRCLWCSTGIVIAFALVGCDNEPDEITDPEPEVFNFQYLSVEITAPHETPTISRVRFHADDLETYSYVLNQNGSRRVQCSSATFLDADDEMVTQDENTITYITDSDVIFDIVDLNGNIMRFTPSITGATTLAIHDAGGAMTDEQQAIYSTALTREVNKLPNVVFEQE